MTDPDESRRLGELYSGMSDGELQKIASDSASLTELASSALASEMERRALQVEPSAPSEDGSHSEVELQSLVTIRKFRDLPEALLAKGSLDSAGIESFLADDNMVRMDWFISNLLGGVKLLVKPEDVEQANQILDQPIPEDFAVEGVGEYTSPRCPHCQSVDVIVYTGAFIGLPPILQPRWKCNSCGREWDDTESGS
jgi:Putative prokaryotic signal transducing protein